MMVWTSAASDFILALRSGSSLMYCFSKDGGSSTEWSTWDIGVGLGYGERGIRFQRCVGNLDHREKRAEKVSQVLLILIDPSLYQRT